MQAGIAPARIILPAPAWRPASAARPSQCLRPIAVPGRAEHRCPSTSAVQRAAAAPSFTLSAPLARSDLDRNGQGPSEHGGIRAGNSRCASGRRPQRPGISNWRCRAPCPRQPITRRCALDTGYRRYRQAATRPNISRPCKRYAAL